MVSIIEQDYQEQDQPNRENMNIFKTNESPKISARNLPDKHVVKMPLETAQVLSTTKRIFEGKLTTLYVKRVKLVTIDEDSKPYKIKTVRLVKKDIHVLPSDTIINKLGLSILVDKKLYLETHVNHQSTRWVRQSAQNYQWLLNHFIALCDEYKYRFNRTHASYALLDALCITPHGLAFSGDTPLIAVVSDTCKHPNPVIAYQLYHHYEKRMFGIKRPTLAKWTGRVMPSHMVYIHSLI